MLGGLASGGCGAGGAETALAQSEIEARVASVRTYFDNRRFRYEIVATTTTDSGQRIDWIRPETQTADGVIATPPSAGIVAAPRGVSPRTQGLATPPADAERHEEVARSELASQPHARGPAGSVPIVWFDVDSYLALFDVPPSDPSSVITSLEGPTPDANDRYYAAWQQTTESCFGAAGWINVWDTEDPIGRDTSIAQVAVIGGEPMQAIEAGKIEASWLNGDERAYFFTYFRTAGGATGDAVGGYNTMVDGWVQVSDVVFPGMSLQPWVSEAGGRQGNLDVEVRLHEGNWWVAVGGAWAGYYRGELFTSDGIANAATRVAWYGEVFAASAPEATDTDMGSGAHAGEGFGGAAYFRNVRSYWSPDASWWWETGAVLTTDDGCYDRAGPFVSAEDGWRNWFFYGGPGAEADHCE